MCRICREAGSKEDLLTTCGCKGTMKYIHLSCLEHWLAESDSTKCELCSFQYQTVRTPKLVRFNTPEGKSPCKSR